jgi:hypothetical protein
MSFAIWNFVQHRDISANMFVAAFLIIQGGRYIPDEQPSRQLDHVSLLCIILSVAVCLFAGYGFFTGMDWKHPKSW